MPAHLDLEKADQFWLQESVIIGYVEADNARACQSLSEAALQLASMRLLHDKNQVGPSDQFSREWVFRIMVRPGRVYLQFFSPREHLLGRWASQLVLATHEQDRSDAWATQSGTYKPRQASGYGATSAE